jgi:uncharacterized cupin superfamily protein
MTGRRQRTPSAFLDARQVLAGPLPEEVSMEPVLQGAPFAYEKTVSDGPEGFCAVWACDAGVFPRVKDKRGSFMYIISGDGTIVDEDGTPHELHADSVLVLPFGWVGTWHIRETIRKVYIHTTPSPPLPESVVPCAFLPAGDVLESEAVVFDGPDGYCAISEFQPGEYPGVPDAHGSFVYVISGEATVTDQDGTRHELTAGSVLTLPSGWAGTWDIHQTIRAFAVRSTPAPTS